MHVYFHLCIPTVRHFSPREAGATRPLLYVELMNIETAHGATCNMPRSVTSATVLPSRTWCDEASLGTTNHVLKSDIDTPGRLGASVSEFEVRNTGYWRFDDEFFFLSSHLMLSVVVQNQGSKKRIAIVRPP